MLEAVRTLNLEPFFTCLSQSQSAPATIYLAHSAPRLKSGKVRRGSDERNLDDCPTKVPDLDDGISSGATNVRRTRRLQPSSGPFLTALRAVGQRTPCSAGHHSPAESPIFHDQTERSLQLAPQMETRLKQTFDEVFAPVLKETVGKALGTMLKN